MDEINIDYFNQLPPDLQSKILTYKPSFNQLSTHYDTPYYRDIHRLQHCHLPITINEFKRYINTSNPETFIIYISDKDKHENPIWIIYKLELTYPGYYNVISKKLYIDEVDEGQFIINIRENVLLNTKLKNILIENYDIYYDLQSIKNILHMRGCNNLFEYINPSDTFDVVNMDDNIWSMFNHFKQLFYIYFESELIFDKVIYHPYDLFDDNAMGYDSFGNIADDDMENKIKLINKMTKKSEIQKKDLLQWMQNDYI